MKVGPEPCCLEAGHKPRHVEGVDANIGRSKRGPSLGRIDPPKLSFTVRGDRLDGPILTEFDEHLADVAKLSVLHHLAGLPHHRKGGKTIGHTEDQSRRLLLLYKVNG